MTLEKCEYKEKVEYFTKTQSARNDIIDIEDLVEKGKTSKACPYYTSRRLAKNSAQVIFCTFNYIIDPSFID